MGRNDVVSVFFRHGLVDKVAEKAETLTVEQIRGRVGVRNIIHFLDDHYEPYQKISDYEDFERAVYGHERLSTETCTANVIKNKEFFHTRKRCQAIICQSSCKPRLCSDTLHSSRNRRHRRLDAVRA